MVYGPNFRVRLVLLSTPSAPGSGAQLEVAPQGSISNARVLVCSSEAEPEPGCCNLSIGIEAIIEPRFEDPLKGIIGFL